MGKIPKIVYFVTELFPKVGGIQKYNFQFANTLADLYGKENITVIPSNNDFDSGFPGYRFKVGLLGREKSHGFLRFFNYLIKFIATIKIFTKERPSVVIVSHVDQCLVPFILSRLFLKKFVILTYGSEVWNKLSKIKTMILKKSDRICTISKFTANKLIKKGVDQGKIFYIPVAIDLDVFREKEKNQTLISSLNLKDAFVLLTVGRMDKTEQHKGHDIAIEALSLVVNSYKKIRYLIVGNGDDVPRLKEMAANLEVIDIINFIGNVSESELVDYYNLCDVYLMPNRIEVKNGMSIGEGFGIVFLEANACSKPVIAGNMGGSVEAVVDGYNGLIVDSMSKEDVANKIKLFIESKDLAEKMGKNGLEFVKSRYSIELLKEKVQELISCIHI